MLEGFQEPELSDNSLKVISAERLASLSQLCLAHGARLIFVIPPTFQKGANVIAVAGEQRGVGVLIPVGANEFDSSRFQSDRLHLNAAGAQEFTARPATVLKQYLPKQIPFAEVNSASVNGVLMTLLQS
jgi:hypothetical protein